LMLLMATACCNGCLSYTLIHSTSERESLSRPQAAYIATSGDLLLEVVDASQHAGQNRYVVIRYRDLAPYIPVVALDLIEADIPRVRLPQDIPHTIVAMKSGRSDVVPVDPELLKRTGQRIEFQPEHGPDSPLFLYSYGGRSAMITRSGLMDKGYDLKKASVPGTILCYVLIVPAFAVDVLTFPIQVIWIATGPGFNSQHAH